MDIKILNMEGKQVGTKSVLAVFDGKSASPALVHQVAVSSLANQRVSRAHTKDRAERRGGGKKPWRQKGTGRARHGSSRSPLWRKGGVTFGPRSERTYGGRVSSSMKTSALIAALQGKVADEELFLVEALPATDGKTKTLLAAFAKLPVRGATLLIVPGTSADRESYRRASRNVAWLTIKDPVTVTVADLLTHTTVVMPSTAMDALEARVTKNA